jgi:hypothetical protein
MKRGQMTRQRPWRHLYRDPVICDRRYRWGNSHTVGPDRCRCGAVHSRAGAVAAYKLDLILGVRIVPSLDRPDQWHDLDMLRREPKNRDRVCWCPLDDGPCHAQVQVEVIQGGRP